MRVSKRYLGKDNSCLELLEKTQGLPFDRFPYSLSLIPCEKIKPWTTPALDMQEVEKNSKKRERCGDQHSNAYENILRQ